MGRRELRGAYIALCEQLQPSVMITLATNQAWSITKMTALTKEFFGRLDRKGLGHTYSKAPPSARADGVVLIEKADLNVHAHALVTVPYGKDLSIQLVGGMLWEKLCPSGSFHIRAMEPNDPHYCTKEMVRGNYQTEQLVLLRGLMSQKSLDARTN